MIQIQKHVTVASVQTEVGVASTIAAVVILIAVEEIVIEIVSLIVNVNEIHIAMIENIVIHTAKCLVERCPIEYRIVGVGLGVALCHAPGE